MKFNEMSAKFIKVKKTCHPVFPEATSCQRSEAGMFLAY